MKQSKVFTYGRDALSEALRHAPRDVTKGYLDRTMTDTKVGAQIDHLQIPVAKLSEGMARSDMKSGVAHQGIIGSVSLFALVQPFAKFVETLAPAKGTALVLLNGVQDPHNVGAIIRTAAGFGASAVLLPERGTAAVSGAVIKVSAGVAFRIPLVQGGGGEQTIIDLKRKGFKMYGLAGGAGTPLPPRQFDAPAVF